MDLYSGYPYWLIKNPLYNHIHELRESINTDTVIIGSGITGALVAHELCSHGLPCVIVDKRALATGSTAASTAQLQYEIDVPLSELVKKLQVTTAVTAYQASLQAISDVEQVFLKTGLDADFERKSSLYLASNNKALQELEEELAIRQRYGLPVTGLGATALQQRYGISRPGALYNDAAAQMDTYKATTGLLHYHHGQGGLQLFPYTEITRHQATRDGYELLTGNGKIIKCRNLVIASGYEAGTFLPEKVMDLVSTYALVTEPVPPSAIWPEACLIWETARPYFYLRTTGDNRIMIGGEDIPFRNEQLRDLLLKRKTNRLLKTFRQLFPGINIKCEMTWCGTFSSTKDGLPFIGCYPGLEHMYFALGYGGNGITFSMIAAQLICKHLLGQTDDRAAVFGFERR